MLVFDTVILRRYTINNDYLSYNICSTWLLDIRISTCSPLKSCME